MNINFFRRMKGSYKKAPLSISISPGNRAEVLDNANAIFARGKKTAKASDA